MKRRTLLKRLGAAVVAAPIALVAASQTKPAEVAAIAPESIVTTAGPTVPFSQDWLAHDAVLSNEMATLWRLGFPAYVPPRSFEEMLREHFRCPYGCEIDSYFSLREEATVVYVSRPNDETVRASIVIEPPFRPEEANRLAEMITHRLEYQDLLLHMSQLGEGAVIA